MELGVLICTGATLLKCVTRFYRPFKVLKGNIK